MTLVLPPGVNGTISVIGFVRIVLRLRAAERAGEGGDQGRDQE